MFEPDGEIKAIVVDIGSSSCKFGFAGEESPRSVIPSVVGRLQTDEDGDCFIGEEALSRENDLRLTFPVRGSIITSWEDMEKIWHHAFFHDLEVTPEDYAIFLTEPLLNPKANRERMTTIMFDTFRAPAVFINCPAILSSFVSGRNSAIVVEIGDGASSVVPIYEGYVLMNLIRRFGLVGNDFTECMAAMLNARGYSFETLSEKRIAQDIKDKLCYVAFDFDEDMEICGGSSEIEKNYEMPDGSYISIGEERFKCPEALFKPLLIGKDVSGLHNVVHDVINAAYPQIQSELFNNIVLSGGSTCFGGLADRLTDELVKLVSTEKVVEIVDPPGKRYSAWIGGSTQASLEAFKRMWVTRDEYETQGVVIVNSKCT